MSIPHWRIVADLFGVVYRADGCEVLRVVTYSNNQGIDDNQYIEIDLRYNALLMQVTMCTVIRHCDCVRFRASIDAGGERLLLCDETDAVEKFEEFFGGDKPCEK